MDLHLTTQSAAACQALGAAFAAAGHTLFLVGGAVRDRLLGRGESGDFDFTTSAPAADIPRISRALARACYDKSPAKGYGTHGVILKSGPEVEITPYRDWAAFATAARADQAGAPPGALTLETDLFGRDFTINAMAVDVSPDRFGALVDPCGGAADLATRRIRTPVDPARTFADDPLRLVRAVRLAAALNFSIEQQTLACARALAAAGALGRTAPERVREELFRMLTLPAPSHAITLLRDTGLLAVILPEVQALALLTPDPDTHHKDNFLHTLRVLDSVAGAGPACEDPAVRFAALVHDIGKPAARRLDNGLYSFADHDKIGAELADALCERLRFSNVQRARTVRLVRLHHRLHPYTGEWTDAAVRRAVNELGPDLDAVLALSRADITSSDPDKVAARRAALDQFENRVQGLDRAAIMNPKPPLDGLEIMRLLGLDAGGPEVGRAVQFLKDQIVTGTLDAHDADTARRMVLNREWTQA